MNRNKLYDCRGNQPADNLLYMLESTSVLSEAFIRKITNIVLVILSNLDKNEEWVLENIEKLKSEMAWMTIFSEPFKNGLIDQLYLSYNRQKEIDKNETQTR